MFQVVPNLFTSLGIVTKLFDIGSSQQARKSAARILCLLRNMTSVKNGQNRKRLMPGGVVNGNSSAGLVANVLHTTSVAHSVQNSTFTITPLVGT